MYRLYFCGLGIVMILSKEKTERLKVFIFYLRETASNIAKKKCECRLLQQIHYFADKTFICVAKDN